MAQIYPSSQHLFKRTSNYNKNNPKLFRVTKSLYRKTAEFAKTLHSKTKRFWTCHTKKSTVKTFSKRLVMTVGCRFRALFKRENWSVQWRAIQKWLRHRNRPRSDEFTLKWVIYNDQWIYLFVSKLCEDQNFKNFISSLYGTLRDLHENRVLIIKWLKIRAW